MSKIIFYSIETTGTDSKVHGIHQLAGEIVIDGKVVDKFDFRINPFKGYKTDLRALGVSKTTPLDLLRYQQENRAFISFWSKLDKYHEPTPDGKFILAGWNNHDFHDSFLKELFKRNSHTSPFDVYFQPHSIDVKVLATQHLINDLHRFDKFYLIPVARYLGISIGETSFRKASYNACLTRIVYDKIMQDARMYECTN